MGGGLLHDQESAELVAVQGESVRLIIQPRPPDVGGWGVLGEGYPDGVPGALGKRSTSSLPILRGS